MSESRSPADSLVDLFVYLPLGAALAAKEMAPELSRKGRRLVQDRLTSARLIGELAVKGLERAGSGFLGSGVSGRGGQPTPAAAPNTFDPGGSTANDGPDDEDKQATGAEVEGPDALAVADRRRRSGAAAGTSGGADALAIPGYDSLSAFQVVQRLEGLSKAELDAVRAHEQAGRKRQTVLNRISQLSAAS